MTTSTSTRTASTLETTTLETGSGPTTPPGDNLLTDFARAEAAAYRALAQQAGGRSTFDDELGLAMSDAGSPCYFGNVAYATRPLDGDGAREAVRRVRRFYDGGAGGPYLLLTPWSLGDLGPDSFVLAGHPPLMVRPAGGAVPASGDARIVHARSATDVADFDQTLSEAYPAEALLPYGTQPALFTAGIVDTGWELVTAYLGDQPVATAGAYATDQVVAIEAVSTRPSFRGRGLGALVTAAAAATSDGVPAALLSSDAGRSVYEAIGFLPVMRFTLWIGDR